MGRGGNQEGEQTMSIKPESIFAAFAVFVLAAGALTMAAGIVQILVMVLP